MRRANVERVLGYVRVSGQEQGRSGTSLDAQREAIERHCTAHALPSPKIYVEVESAGAEKLERRAELRALLAELRAGDLVIVRSQDRWSRATEWFLSSMRDIKARGASFFSIAEQFDPDTPQGRYAATIMAATFEHERELIRGRTVGRRKELRNAGFYVEGLPPIGYRREKRKLVIVPEDAAIVRDIFARCVHGRSLQDISDHLQVSHPDRHGWDKGSIRTILRSRAYLGEMQDSRGIWIQSHEPIITRALWDKAQEALDGRRKGGRSTTADARTSGWLGRKILRCADCDTAMSAVYDPRHVTDGYYACGARLRGKTCAALYMRVSTTDAALGALVLQRLKDLRRELATVPLGEHESGPEVDHDAMTERIRQQRRKAVSLAIQEVITEAELKVQLADLDAQLGRVEAHREAAVRAERMRAPQARQEALAAVEELERVWPAVTVPERREILRRLARIVRVREGEAPEVEWFSVEEMLE